MANPFGIWLLLMTDYKRRGGRAQVGKSKDDMMAMVSLSLSLFQTAFDRPWPVDFFPHPTPEWLSSLISFSLKILVLFIHVTDIRKGNVFSVPSWQLAKAA